MLEIRARSPWYWPMLSLLVSTIPFLIWGTTLTDKPLIHVDKETWEPFIQSLFLLQPQTGVRVGEVWSSESPNHGQSAIMNEDALVKRPQGICACSVSSHLSMTWLTVFAAGYLWGRAISSLLNSGLIVGKEIVGVGHSVGSTIMFVLCPLFLFVC